MSRVFVLLLFVMEAPLAALHRHPDGSEPVSRTYESPAVVWEPVPGWLIGAACLALLLLVCWRGSFRKSALWVRGREVPLLVVSAALAVTLGWATYTVVGQSGEGTLRVEIRDQATGHLVPAMVCITSLDDHKWRIPPDGSVVPPYSTASQFYDPPSWKPGQIGPVRLTNGEYNDNNVRSHVYDGRPGIPFWREPAAYFVSQPFSIRLPTGKWRLAVARGFEYLPLYEEFEITAGENRTRKIQLKRWVDMAEQGWYSGDDHVHHPRIKAEHNEFLMTWALAEDLHVSNILWMGDAKKTYFEQEGFGKQFRYQRGDYVLVPGQEEPRTATGHWGHVLGLNISATVRDTSRYRFYDLVLDGIRSQGGLAGYAHIALMPDFYRTHPEFPYPHPTWDKNINVVRGRIDFFEILQLRYLGLEDFYDFLNLGFRLTALAGSDWPWGGTLGEVRVYVFTGKPFSVDRWFEAAKEGRTFVTNGPMLTLSVDGVSPGEELKVARNQKIRIEARTWAPSIIGSPKSLEIVAHGQVIRRVESSDLHEQELRLEFDREVKASHWVTARVYSHNGAVAHTSPVYVMAGGEKFWNLKELPRLVEKRLKALEYIEERLEDAEFTADYAPGEVEGLRERVQLARQRFDDLLSAGKAPHGATQVNGN